MQEITLMSRLKYAFDNTMSKGAVALIGWLAALSAFLILLAAIIVTVTGLAPEGSEPIGFAEALWGALMRMLDSGAVGGDVGWSFRIMMLLVTFGGIFILSNRPKITWVARSGDRPQQIAKLKTNDYLVHLSVC